MHDRNHVVLLGNYFILLGNNIRRYNNSTTSGISFPLLIHFIRCNSLRISLWVFNNPWIYEINTNRFQQFHKACIAKDLKKIENNKKKIIIICEDKF